MLAGARFAGVALAGTIAILAIVANRVSLASVATGDALSRNRTGAIVVALPETIAPIVQDEAGASAALPAVGEAPDRDEAAGASVQVADTAGWVRVPRPIVPDGPRRIGLQAGHWRTAEVPDELRRLEHSTGTSWGGVAEWQVNLDIANRTAAILRGHGYAVDVLPTTVPPAYLADVFVALHADGDPSGAARGYKAAHGSRRGPYEGRLVRALMEEYSRATGLPEDPKVTRNMLGYYAFSWSRIPYSAAPHTPAAILEMGFLTNAADRSLLLGQPDRVAAGVANGILRFLAEVTPGAAFAGDIVVPPFRPRGAPPRLPPER